MTNYNDGNWHGWNGGECPVHEKSEIDRLGFNGPGFGPTQSTNLKAGLLDWEHFHGAFRVVKGHQEPREFWIVDGFAYRDEQHGYDNIHVREVIDDDT